MLELEAHDALPGALTGRRCDPDLMGVDADLPPGRELAARGVTPSFKLGTNSYFRNQHLLCCVVPICDSAKLYKAPRIT